MGVRVRWSKRVRLRCSGGDDEDEMDEMEWSGRVRWSGRVMERWSGRVRER